MAPPYNGALVAQIYPKKKSPERKKGSLEHFVNDNTLANTIRREQPHPNPTIPQHPSGDRSQLEEDMHRAGQEETCRANGRQSGSHLATFPKRGTVVIEKYYLSLAYVENKTLYIYIDIIG